MIYIALWMKLLSRGNLIYITESLSRFRLHKEQAQQREDLHEKGLLAWEHALFDARRMGFFCSSGPDQLLGRPLSPEAPDRKKPLSVSIIIPVFGIVGVIAGAVAVVRSKYRQSTDEEREKYIAALEARNKLLEETAERSTKDLRSLRAHYHNLEGKVCMLQELVLRQCRRAEMDAASGGCKHCDLHLAYGQGGTP